jgi:hypothetical protein
MSDYPVGSENDTQAPYNQNDNEFECTECGKPMSSDSGVCSGKCLKSAML